MIRGEYAVIRTAEPDDAAVLARLYDPAYPRAALLDPRREPIFPTFDELREILAKTDMGQPFMYAVEDSVGVIRGFCALRSLALEVRYGEVVAIFLDDADYAAPIGTEVFEFLLRRGFKQFGLNKLMGHALDDEQAFCDAMVRHGFSSCGVQREVMRTLGSWRNLHAYALLRKDFVFDDPSDGNR